MKCGSLIKAELSQVIPFLALDVHAANMFITLQKVSLSPREALEQGARFNLLGRFSI